VRVWLHAVAVLLIVSGVAAKLGAQADPKTALLERDGFRLLETGQARRAAELFRQAIAADPRNGRLHLGAGLAAYVERRDDEARTELERAIALDADLWQAREVLGQLLHRQGDLQGAIRTYAALATDLPDRHDIRDTLERWRREVTLHDRMRHEIGNYFTVSFEGPEETELARRALESLDRAYWRVGDLLGGTYPSDPISIVLYTREQFRDITRSPSWAAGVYDGIIRLPVGGALDKPAELDRVLAHEFTHALVRSLAKSGVPTWLNEGLAAAVESGSLAWADNRIKDAGGTMPLTMLTASFGRFNGAQAEWAYASSATAVRRLIDLAGGYAVANLLRDLGEGVDFDTAFSHRMQQPFSAFAAQQTP
jgi:tetratricopeptide (TPR) repeat protein